MHRKLASLSEETAGIWHTGVLAVTLTKAADTLATQPNIHYGETSNC